MKSRFAKIVATAMALTMCMPTAAFAASTTPTINGETTGSFNTSFDIYSPALHISVPLKADIQVNPMADTSNTGVRQFSVASNSIDIINASVDTEADTAIPVNVTVQAAITGTGEGVVTAYKSFTVDEKSTKKKINLMLTEASTAAVLDETNRAAMTGDKSKLLDLSTVPVKTAAEYTGATNSTAITKYGSLLSVDIVAPTLETGITSYIGDPTKVKAAVGSFAVTGVANTNADWAKDDIAVAITYKVKASNTLSIETPTVASVTQVASATTDLTITVPDVGEATVTALALHNDDAYGDIVWEDATDDVTYAPNATTTTQTDATIKIKKDNAILTTLAGDEFKTKAQELVIALSDGRMVVTDITVN